MKRILVEAVAFVSLWAVICCAEERRLFHSPSTLVHMPLSDFNDLKQRNRELTRRVDDLTAVTAESQVAVDQEAAQARLFADDRDALRARVKELEEKLAKVPADQFSIEGLSTIKPTSRPVQWVITSSPSCGPCQRWKQHAARLLRGYVVNESPDAHFRIVELTDTEWRKLDILLPRAELRVHGKTETELIGPLMDHVAMAKLYVEAEAKAMSAESAYGIGVGSIPVKAQVSAMLDALKPFLDGGAFRVEYKPKPGVIREWLTIRQGATGVKIAPTTAIVFGFEGDSFVGRFEGVAPRVLLGPFERSPTAIEISPERIAVRLPWCPDPEIKLTE